MDSSRLPGKGGVTSSDAGSATYEFKIALKLAPASRLRKPFISLYGAVACEIGSLRLSSSVSSVEAGGSSRSILDQKAPEKGLVSDITSGRTLFRVTTIIGCSSISIIIGSKGETVGGGVSSGSYVAARFKKP